MRPCSPGPSLVSSGSSRCCLARVSYRPFWPVASGWISATPMAPSTTDASLSWSPPYGESGHLARVEASRADLPEEPLAGYGERKRADVRRLYLIWTPGSSVGPYAGRESTPGSPGGLL